MGVTWRVGEVDDAQSAGGKVGGDDVRRKRRVGPGRESVVGGRAAGDDGRDREWEHEMPGLGAHADPLWWVSVEVTGKAERASRTRRTASARATGIRGDIGRCDRCRGSCPRASNACAANAGGERNRGAERQPLVDRLQVGAIQVVGADVLEVEGGAEAADRPVRAYERLEPRTGGGSLPYQYGHRPLVAGVEVREAAGHPHAAAAR